MGLFQLCDSVDSALGLSLDGLPLGSDIVQSVFMVRLVPEVIDCLGKRSAADRDGFVGDS